MKTNRQRLIALAEALAGFKAPGDDEESYYQDCAVSNLVEACLREAGLEGARQGVLHHSSESWYRFRDSQIGNIWWMHMWTEEVIAGQLTCDHLMFLEGASDALRYSSVHFTWAGDFSQGLENYSAAPNKSAEEEALVQILGPELALQVLEKREALQD